MVKHDRKYVKNTPVFCHHEHTLKICPEKEEYSLPKGWRVLRGFYQTSAKFGPNIQTWRSESWPSCCTDKDHPRQGCFCISYPAAVMLPRTCSTRAFASAPALSSAAAWSFCTHSCCKFLISAKCNGLGFKPWVFGSGCGLIYKWERSVLIVLGSFLTCHEHQRRYTDVNMSRDWILMRQHVLATMWIMYCKRECRTLKATLFGL